MEGLRTPLGLPRQVRLPDLLRPTRLWYMVWEEKRPTVGVKETYYRRPSNATRPTTPGKTARLTTSHTLWHMVWKHSSATKPTKPGRHTRRGRPHSVRRPIRGLAVPSIPSIRTILNTIMEEKRPTVGVKETYSRRKRDLL